MVTYRSPACGRSTAGAVRRPRRASTGGQWPCAGDAIMARPTEPMGSVVGVHRKKATRAGMVLRMPLRHFRMVVRVRMELVQAMTFGESLVPRIPPRLVGVHGAPCPRNRSKSLSQGRDCGTIASIPRAATSASAPPARNGAGGPYQSQRTPASRLAGSATTPIAPLTGHRPSRELGWNQIGDEGAGRALEAP